MLVSIFACTESQKTSKAHPKETSKTEKYQEPDCDNDVVLQDLNSRPFNLRLKWLKENGDKLCDSDLYLCIEKDHQITCEKFYAAARKHPENKEKIIYHEKSWKEINTFISDSGIKCYENYIGFILSPGNIKMKKLDFTDEETCYSVPFINGIKKLNPNGLEFHFVKAMFENKKGNDGKIVDVERVIFMVKSTKGTYYYDISDNPKFTFL